MSANPDTSAPRGRNKPAQGKELSDAALGYASQNTPSPEGAKQGGELPSGWKLSKLSELLTVLRGVSYKKEDASSEPATDRVPILRATNIQNGLVFEDFVHVPRHYVSNDQLLRKGDIVIAASSGSRNIVGKAAQLTTDWFGSFGTFCFGLRPKPGIHPSYLAWFLQTSEYRHQISELSAGVNINNLRATHIEEIPIPVAPLSEQRRIVAEIEKQFTRLEAGVAALRRVQANLKRYRAAVLAAACEGRLVPTEAEVARAEGRPFESGQQLLARILNRRKELFEQRKADGGRRRFDDPSPIEPGALPFTPEGWTLASAESVCSSVRDGTHDTPAYVADGVPLITSKNLLPAGLDFENVKFVSREDHIEIGKRSGVERGDILFAMIGTIGNPVVVETDREFSIKNVGLFKANRDFILSRYLRYWFMSPPFTRWLEPKQRGTTQKFVPLGLLRALVVALPPLAEQARIVAEVERRLSVVEELEAVVTTNLQRATRLRQSILQKAFTGELFEAGEMPFKT